MVEKNTMDFFGSYMDQQKKMMDMWMNAWQPAMQSNMGMPFSNPGAFFKPMQDLWKNSFTGYTGNPVELYHKMNQSMSSYYQLMKMWEEIYKRDFVPNRETAEKMAKEWMDKSGELAQHYFLPLFPEEVQNLLKEVMNAGQVYQDAMSSYVEPWSKAMLSFNEAMAQGMMNHPGAIVNVFDDWQSAYKDTLGKVFNMPMMGLTRESADAQLQAIDRYIKLMSYTSEFVAKIVGITSENSRNVIIECVENLAKGEQPKTFEAFYDFWKASLDHSFDDLFYSDEFSKLLGEVVDALMEFKLVHNKVLEQNLSFLPIPLKSDMDSLYKTIYELKREVRGMKKQMTLLEEQLKKPESK